MTQQKPGTAKNTLAGNKNKSDDATASQATSSKALYLQLLQEREEKKKDRQQPAKNKKSGSGKEERQIEESATPGSSTISTDTKAAQKGAAGEKQIEERIASIEAKGKQLLDLHTRLNNDDVNTEKATAQTADILCGLRDDFDSEEFTLDEEEFACFLDDVLNEISASQQDQVQQD